VELPAYGIEFSTGDQLPATSIISETLTFGVPVTIEDEISSKNDVYLGANSDTKAILGINAYDNSDLSNNGLKLNSVIVKFENVSGFTLEDLANPTADTGSGIALYIDNPETGTIGKAGW